MALFRVQGVRPVAAGETWLLFRAILVGDSRIADDETGMLQALSAPRP